MVLIQACLVPGGGGHVITTGIGGKAGVERAEVAISWIQAHATTMAHSLQLESLVRDLRGPRDGVHIHSRPALHRNSPSSLGVTIALALASLATGRRPSDRVAVLGELRLDGARTQWIDGLTKSCMETCADLGFQQLVVGPQQVMMTHVTWRAIS